MAGGLAVRCRIQACRKAEGAGGGCAGAGAGVLCPAKRPCLRGEITCFCLIRRFVGFGRG